MPSPDNIIHLSVVRLAGTFGKLVLYWEALPATANVTDFSPTAGDITFKDGEVKLLRALMP